MNHKIATQTSSVVAGINNIDGGHYSMDVDSNGLLASRGYVWDTVGLAWVASSSAGGGGSGTSSGFPVGQYTSMTLTGDATHDVVTYSNGKVKTITYTDSTKSAVSSVVLT